MRYTLTLILLVAMLMVLVLAVRFPEFLERYSTLQEAIWKVRGWLGIDSPRSAPSTDRQLKEIERTLREESALKKGTSQLELEDYKD
jgi:hypothetical protein